MKRKILVFIFSLFIVLGLISCSSSGSGNNNSDSSDDVQDIQNNTDLVIDGFTKNDDSYLGKIDNVEEVFSFLNVVTVSEEATWKLYTDVTGTNEIATKTVNLELGDNIYYILVTASPNDMKLYTVNVYRFHMYTVSFNTNGGTAIPSQQVQEESLITPVSDPEKIGYDFSGWDYDFSVPVMSNLTIRANWSAHKCDIIFDVNGGESEISDKKVNYGSYVSLPTPTKTGYSFGGWYLNDKRIQSGNWYYEGTTCLRAKWTVNTYEIIYNPNGGTLPDGEIQYVSYGDDFTLQMPSRTGYSFDGWYNEDSLFETGTWNYLSDISLTAKWTANSYHVTLVLNDGSIDGDSEFDINYDSTLTLPTPTRTGYSFDGWFDSNTQVYSGQWKYLTNKTFKARWTPESYTVTINDVTRKLYSVRYDYNDGRGTFKEIELGVGDSIEYPIPVSSDKNTFFVGWYTEPECKNVYRFNNDITGSLQLYAKWKTIDMVDFIAFRGDTVLNRQAYIDYSTPLVFVAPYTGQLDLKISGVRSGFYIAYTLYKYENGSGKSVGTVEINKSGSTTINYTVRTLNVVEGDVYYLALFAATDSLPTFSMKINFELINKLSMNSKVNSKLTMTSINVIYDSSFILEDIIYPGYEFIGWYSEDNGGGVKIDPSKVWRGTNVTDVYPYLVPIQYTIYLEPNSGSISQSTKAVTYNSPFTLPTPTRTGYSFEGWFYNDILVSSGNWIYTSNITLTAKWNPNNYKCTFSEYSSGRKVYLSLNMNDGYQGVYEKIELSRDQAISYPIPPQRTNYCFTGWYTDAACTKEFDLSSEIKNDTTIYAGWRVSPTSVLGGNKKEDILLNGEKKEYSFTNTLYLLIFVALDSGTYYFNYENASADVGYFLHDYDDSSVGSDRVTSISGSGSFAINVVKGHMYYVGLAGDIEGSTVVGWLTGDLPSTSVKLSQNLDLTMEFIYGMSYNLGLPVIPQGKTFVGWYTGVNGTGIKLTNSNGESLDVWKYTTTITVYPYFI